MSKKGYGQSKCEKGKTKSKSKSKKRGKCQGSGSGNGPRGRKGQKGYWAKVPRREKGKKKGAKGSLNALEDSPNATAGSQGDKVQEERYYDEIWVEIPADDAAWDGEEGWWQDGEELGAGESWDDWNAEA